MYMYVYITIYIYPFRQYHRHMFDTLQQDNLAKGMQPKNSQS